MLFGIAPRAGGKTGSASGGGSIRSSFALKATLSLGLAVGLPLALGGCLGYNGQVVHGYQRDPRTLEQVKAGAPRRSRSSCFSGRRRRRRQSAATLGIMSPR